MPQRVLVFDNIEWAQKGDCQDGHGNECYYRPAIVQNIRYAGPRDGFLVDVIFDHRPQHISRGHFATGVKGLKYE